MEAAERKVELLLLLGAVLQFSKPAGQCPPGLGRSCGGQGAFFPRLEKQPIVGRNPGEKRHN